MKCKRPTFIIALLALSVCLGLSSCLSQSPQSDIEQTDSNNSSITDDSSTPTITDNDIYPLQGGFADEGMLNSGDYHEFTADSSEYTVKLVFKANEVLTDVHFYSLEYGDNGALAVSEELYTLSELTPDKPLVTGVVFYGSMTTYGISFTDSDGQTHHCAVSLSGEDGSLLMNEYTP